MKVNVRFDSPTNKLVIDGYEKKHSKHLDSAASIDYTDIPEYIKLGKQVRRRQRFSSFLENWGTVLFWAVIIAGFIGWTMYSNHQTQVEIDKRSESSYQRFLDGSKSSKSGIYDAESCPITTCSDGSCSSSTGRGTCSYHGGIAY